MIRVELLGRRRSPWSKALLAALVVCGGLYGTHRFFPVLAESLFSAGSAFIPAVQQEAQQEAQQDKEAAASPVGQQESVAQRDTVSSLVAQRDTVPSPVVQQEVEPELMAQQDTVPSPVARQEITPEPAEQEATPKPVVAPRDTIPSSGMQQAATPSSVQEVEPKPATQQEAALSSATQQDTLPSPATQQAVSQRIASNPVAQPAAATPTPTLSQAPAPPRSTVCHQVMRIDEQVPAGIRLASLNCNSTGAYWLEGTSPSHKVLREFRLRLQALPSQVSFQTWQEGRALRFAFQGRFAEQDTPPLAALSSGQAEQFLGKVARWADASGLDSLSVHKPIPRVLSPVRTHQRQKLLGIGSPQQIDAFLKELQQAEAIATLGEVLLMPVQSDERGWVKARLYAAVDVIVDAP